MIAERLKPHYSRFRVAERLLLTGHSHQAWPDVGFEGVVEAWEDAASLVDEKWERAAERADRVRQGFARLLGDPGGVLALGQNTHELVVRFLSALSIERRPRLVTTDGEFHTLRRQLDRLAEDGRIEVVKIPSEPASAIAERAAAAVSQRTAAVLVSSVLFGNARIVPGLDRLAERCRAEGSELLVDAYHHLNVIPFDVRSAGLESAFVVGGGYKYCQLGEGNCFMRVPPNREDLRPILTGWYSEFARLSDRAADRVPYGEGAARWAGATYDPTSHYRAGRVLDFFEREGLHPELLRQVSQHQIGYLARAFDALDLDPQVITRDRETPLGLFGGFLSLKAPKAGEICARLRARGVMTDYRADLLRMGPAPYLSDGQLGHAVALLGEVVKAGI